MLGLILAAESLHLPIRILVLATYVTFGVAFVWSVCTWLTSNRIYEMDPMHWSNKRRKNATPADRLKLFIWKTGVSALILCLFAFFMWATYETNLAVSLQRLNGLLIPADEPNPTDACQPNGDRLVVYMGSAVAFSTEDFPVVLLAAEQPAPLPPEPVLSIDRNQDGSMNLSGNLFDKDGKIVAHIERDHFDVNPNAEWKFLRHSFSDLQVFDNYNVMILNVHVYNSHAISLSGLFHGSSGSSIEVTGNPGRFCMSLTKGSKAAALMMIALGNGTTKANPPPLPPSGGMRVY